MIQPHFKRICCECMIGPWVMQHDRGVDTSIEEYQNRSLVTGITATEKASTVVQMFLMMG